MSKEVRLFDRERESEPCGLRVELYAPPDPDPQQPHLQDEIYIVAEGSGEFWVEDLPAPVPFKERDFLFVPAGKAHRFVNFTNLKVWVLFYGAEGFELERAENSSGWGDCALTSPTPVATAPPPETPPKTLSLKHPQRKTA